MTEELRKEAYQIYETNNQEGLHVLAIAQKNHIHGIETFGIQDEENMVLIGFVGFLDPPKESAKQAISVLKNHGVETVVLTGDSEGVALNVCKKVGIKVTNRLTGKEVEQMTEEELREKAKQLLLSTFLVTVIIILICFTDIAIIFDLRRLPYAFMVWILILVLIYIVMIQIYKKVI